MVGYFKQYAGRWFEDVSYDKSTKRVTFKVIDKVDRVRFPKSLVITFGFTKSVLFKSQKYEIAAFPPRLNNGVSDIYIYSSLTAPIHVGDSKVPLLKSLWVDTKNYSYGDIINVVMQKPMYLPIYSKTINDIEINIRKDTGEYLPLTNNTVTSLTLHFKKDESK